MQMPISITFREMTPSPTLSSMIEGWARKLDDQFGLQRCAVVVEQPHRHQRRGAPFAVHLDITIPGHEVAVSRDASHAQRDPYTAVADAFRAARRQLIDFTAQRREARH